MSHRAAQGRGSSDFNTRADAAVELNGAKLTLIRREIGQMEGCIYLLKTRIRMKHVSFNQMEIFGGKIPRVEIQNYIFVFYLMTKFTVLFH